MVKDRASFDLDGEVYGFLKNILDIMLNSFFNFLQKNGLWEIIRV